MMKTFHARLTLLALLLLAGAAVSCAPAPKPKWNWASLGDLSAHRVGYPAMGVVPIVGVGNEGWQDTADLQALAKQVRAAVPTGDVGISLRAYSQASVKDNLWTTNAARWSTILARRKQLADACKANGIKTLWLDFEWDPAFDPSADPPTLNYPRWDGKQGWNQQAWQQPPGVNMAQRGRDYAAALAGVQIGVYGPWSGHTAAASASNFKPPPGFLPFMRSLRPSIVIPEDIFIGSPLGTRIVAIVRRDLPGASVVAGIPLDWSRAGDVNYLKGKLAPALRQSPDGLCFWTSYPNWFRDLDSATTTARIGAALKAVN